METLTKPKTGSRRKTLPDTQPAPIGHNDPPMALDQEGFLIWMSKLKEQNQIVAKFKKIRDKVRKLAKNAGVEMAIMDRILKEEDADPDTIIRWMKTYRTYSEWAQNPVGTQISMFDLPNSALLSFEEREKKAKRAGYALGLLGRNPDTQAYPQDNELHQAHLEGWHDGQRVLLERIKPIEDAINSEGKADAPAAEDSEKDEMEDA